ncbi:MAG: hypothetical protein JNL60_00425, partial [Bacteroidia bacterium]|nr:hypothetical protein [Bacteroidia bacterium]
MPKQVILLVCVFVFFVNQVPAFGQEPKNQSIKKLGREYGINDNYVSDIVQDKRGVYWASGLNGLIMFDGKRTKRFKLPFYKDKILQSNILSTLFFENDSTLWISNTLGVCRFNVYRHTFSSIPINKEYPSQTINFSVIVKGKNGQVWLSTRELGLMVYDPKTGSIQKPELTLLADLARVREILFLKSGKILFCHYKGLLLYDPVLKKDVPLTSEPELSLLSDTSLAGTYSALLQQENNVYACFRKPGRSSFSVFSGNSLQNQKNILPLRSSFGFRFFKDYKNNIWIYNDGVYQLERSTGKTYNILTGKQETFSQCYSIYEDFAKNLWFCTNNGLYVLESEQVILENNSEQVKDEFVSHIHTDINVFNQEIWLGTYGDGLVILDSNFQFRQNIDLGKIAKDPDFNNVALLYADQTKTKLWIGCILGKLARYDLLSKAFKFYNDTIFHQQRIGAIQQNINGEMYIGTNSGRIVRYDAKEDKFILVYNELLQKKDAIDYISNICFRGKDTLFASTLFNGLYRLTLNDNKVKSYKLDPDKNNTLKSNDLYCMTDLGERGIFFGSSNGILHFNPYTEKFDSYTPSEGAPFAELYSICAYENNELLCTTSDGLYAIDFEKRNARKIGANSPIEQINFSKAFYLSEKKKILLGTDDFFYTLYYQKRPFTYIGKTSIFELKTTDTSYFFSDELPGKIKLKRNQNSFTLFFGSAGYKHAEDLEFYYQVEELSDAWTYLGNLNEIALNNLKGGTYTIRLKSVNKETKLQVEELVLPVIIAKAYYETAWFYILISLVILGILYLVYRIRLNKLLAIEKVRLKLSGDLHDDIGSTLSTINILSN